MRFSGVGIFEFLFVLIFKKCCDEVDQNKRADASFPWFVDVFADKKDFDNEIESL